MDIQSRDSALLIRDSEPRSSQVVDSRGSYVIGIDGRKYVDFLTGWCVGNFGWRNEEIERHMKSFDGPTYVAPKCIYEPWLQLSESLSDIVPHGLTRCVRTTTGTESVEASLQLARAYTERTKFIAIQNSFHGNSIAINEIMQGGQIPLPLDEKAADKVEQLLKTREYAAMIMEPIICNLAVHIPSPQFMMRVRELCSQYGSLLIFDEVATGFGRTGKLFATEHYSVVPDIMCMAKAMGGGYAPIGATMTTENIATTAGDKFDMYSTFGWHPRSVQAAQATLNFIQANRQNLLQNVAEQSSYFSERISSMKFNCETRVRIKGLAIAIEFELHEFSSRLAAKCEENGLLLSMFKDAILMWPALTIDRATAKEGLDIFEKCAQMD